MHEGPNGAGLSRQETLAEVVASLEGLGTAYIDLYIIHRWDYSVPIEETMEALNDVVRAGKVRYIDGALGALDLDLSSEELTALESPYVPHRVVGAR